MLLVVLVCGSCATPSPQQQQAERQRQYATLDRIRQLETELRELRGQVEEIQHLQGGAPGGFPQLEGRVAVIESRLNIQPNSPIGANGGYPYADNPFTGDTNITDESQGPVTDSGPYAGMQDQSVLQPDPTETLGAGPAGPGPAGMAADERIDFNSALDALRSGRYSEAIGKLEGFRRDHPNSPLVGDATYWLGEAHYTNRDFEPAKRAYLTLGAKYPASPKLPDALLKLGYIFGQLGDEARGREMLEKLVEAFPDSRAASQARARLGAG